MKHKIVFFLVVIISLNSYSQTTIIPDINDRREIIPGLPFLLIAPDARSAAQGDIGVATSVDANSQQWNPSKYVFSEYKSGLAVNYTPYLSQLTNDVFLGNIAYFNKLNSRSAFAASFRFFSLGDFEFRDNAFSQSLIESPNQLTLDASYTLKLSKNYAMSIAFRYLRSDLRLQASDNNSSSANSVGVDLTGYYESQEIPYTNFNGKWRGGFAIQNIGPQIKFDDDGSEVFLPTTMRLGGGFDFIFSPSSKLAVTTEFTKLLVPTPPLLGNEYNFTDVNSNGIYDADIDELGASPIRTDVIASGKSNDVGFLQGMFQSFGDAPGGFSEEIKEFTWALGTEYTYNEVFALRAGYFNESEIKGARRFFALGAGFVYNNITIDLSYLFSASNIQSPLENTLRFSLSFNFGKGLYQIK